MNKVKFLIEKTKTSLKYLGSTGVIISLSVMFSAICLMSLLSLSKTISQQVTSGTARETVGGDAQLWLVRHNLDEVLPQVEELKKEGKITQYAYISTLSDTFHIYSNTLKKYMETSTISVNIYEDSRYPLENTMAQSKAGIGIKELPQNPNGAIITEAFAKTSGIKIGDEISIISQNMYDKYTFKVVGFLSQYVGNSSIFVNKNSVDTTSLTHTIFMDGNQEEIKNKLSDLGPIQTVNATEERNKDSNKMTYALIRGLSIVGLFVGSFGIANSVHAIVTKRKREIGILKSIGFKKVDIMEMLLSEIFVIAVGGSILGIALGYLFFYYLVDILSISLPGAEGVYFNREFFTVEALLTFVVSVVSSILFAFITINRVAEIKPIYALKDLEFTEKIQEKGKNILRFLVIAVIFSGISVFLTKSVKYGLGAVALVAVGIVVFSLIFRFIFFLILKIPVKTRNQIELAWGNLRMNYKKVVLPMVAIFIGMFSVILIGTMIYSSRKYSNDMYKNIEGSDYNVLVKRNTPTDKRVEEKVALFAEDIKHSKVFRRVPLKYSETIPFSDVVAGLGAYNIVEGELPDESIIIPDSYKDTYAIGSTIRIPYLDKEVVLRVSGYYQFKRYLFGDAPVFLWHTSIPSDGLVVSKGTFDKYFTEKFVEESWIAITKSKIGKFSENLSTINEIFIFSEDTMENLVNLVMNTLIKFTTSIASLALLAGIILIATVTILDVASKKRDFAILKAIGFRQREITTMVIFEYSIMSVITSIFATSLVYAIVIFLRKFGKQIFKINGERFFFDVNGTIMWNVVIISLVMLIVYFVSKNSLKTKPSEVLRYE